VPPLVLPALDGEPVNLAALGEPALVLFWNPGCGPCWSMVDELRRWGAAAGATAPRLLVVSRAAAEALRPLNLGATVLLDPEGRAHQILGARGTPGAVLLDAGGRVASDVAGGAQAVRALVAQTEAAVLVAA
jgi:hypothetical protein